MNPKTMFHLFQYVFVNAFIAFACGCIAQPDITSLSMSDIQSYAENTTIADFIGNNTMLSNRFVKNNNITGRSKDRFVYKHVFTFRQNGQSITCLYAALHGSSDYYYLFFDGVLERIVYPLSVPMVDTGRTFKGRPVMELKYPTLARLITYICNSKGMSIERYNNHERKIILRRIRDHYSSAEPPPWPLLLFGLADPRKSKKTREYRKLLDIYNSIYLQLDQSCKNLADIYGVPLEMFEVKIDGEDHHFHIYCKPKLSKYFRKPYIGVFCKENRVEGAVTTWGQSFDRDELLKIHQRLVACCGDFGRALQ